MSAASEGFAERVEGIGEEFQVVPARDYAGVSTAQLVAVYNKHIDTDLLTFAKRIGMNERDLKKVVITQNYAFTGWTVTEKILEGLDLDSATLIQDGLLQEVPARASALAARKIAEDEAWAQELDPAETDMDERIQELLELRDRLVVKSPEQEARLRRDSERTQARKLAAKRGCDAAHGTD